MVRNRARPARLQQFSIRIVFFMAGFGMAAWAPLIPFAKARSGMGDGVLGLLLLSLGTGSILAMPLAGAFAARLGCRRVIIGSAVVLCLALPLLASVSNLPLIMAALVLFGASLGSIDVSMNIMAIIIERESGRSMMSGFHGLFSLGGIVGAAGVTALLGAGASPFTATLVVVTGMGIALAKAAPHLLPYGGKRDGPTIGRLSGDKIVQRSGNAKIRAFGGTCAATGFALVTLVPFWPMAVLGFALVGLGCSNVVPVLFTSVGRQIAMPESAVVPAITSFGYAGILVGPAAIGPVARMVSLSAAFLTVALILIGVAMSGRLVGRWEWLVGGRDGSPNRGADEGAAAIKQSLILRAAVALPVLQRSAFWCRPSMVGH